MRTMMIFVTTTIVLLGIGVPAAYAQRGVGDTAGVARQPVPPQLVQLSGRLVEVQAGPCQTTTGRSPAGTHLIVETADKKHLNVHLGPAAVVADLVADLSVGQELVVNAFRTDKMQENHYVAQSLSIGNATATLRDANLAPVWSQGRQGGLAPQDTPQGTAPGWGGRGQGRGYGRGQGAGRRQGTWQWWSTAPLEETATSPQPSKAAGLIAVTATEPSLDAAVDPQFGRCRCLLLINPEDETFEVLDNPTGASPRGAGIEVAALLAQNDVSVLLTGRCGANASKTLAAAKIQIVPDCSGTVRDVVRQFKAGQLPPTSDQPTPAVTEQP